MKSPQDLPFKLHHISWVHSEAGFIVVYGRADSTSGICIRFLAARFDFNVS